MCNWVRLAWRERAALCMTDVHTLLPYHLALQAAHTPSISTDSVIIGYGGGGRGRE